MTRYCFDMMGELEKHFKDTVYKKTGLRRGSIQQELIEAIKLYIEKNKQ